MAHCQLIIHLVEMKRLLIKLLGLYCSTKKRFVQVVVGIATLFCFAVVAIAMTFHLIGK